MKLIRAALTAAVFSGVPSTVHALATGIDPLEASLAAGSMLAPRETRTVPLLAAGAVAHGALSLGWAVMLTAALPRRHTVVAGAVAGLAIAALDLGVVGRRFPRIRALRTGPQVADHVVFGVIVAAVVRAVDREDRPPVPRAGGRRR
jgi:hypothetical protein